MSARAVRGLCEAPVISGTALQAAGVGGAGVPWGGEVPVAHAFLDLLAGRIEVPVHAGGIPEDAVIRHIDRNPPGIGRPNAVAANDGHP